MSPHNSQLVACGGEVVVLDARNAVVATAHNATATDDVAAAIDVVAADGVVVVVGAAATIFVWV